MPINTSYLFLGFQLRYLHWFLNLHIFIILYIITISTLGREYYVKNMFLGTCSILYDRSLIILAVTVRKLEIIFIYIDKHTQYMDRFIHNFRIDLSSLI